MIRILLIEDDEHIAQSIQFFLEGEGFQIKVAAMARQAMEDNSFTEICGVIYIRCMAASILLILYVVSAKLSAICDNSHFSI